MTDKYEEGWRAAMSAFHLGKLGQDDQAAISILRERFVPRVEGPHDALIEQLKRSAEFGLSRIAASTRQMGIDCQDAAATLASLQAELERVGEG